jgi:hypothetical protein
MQKAVSGGRDKKIQRRGAKNAEKRKAGLDLQNRFTRQKKSRRDFAFSAPLRFAGLMIAISLELGAWNLDV